MSKKNGPLEPEFLPDTANDIIDAIEDARLTGKRIMISTPRHAGRTAVLKFLSARPVGPNVETIVLKARQKSDGEARPEDIALHRLMLKS